MGIGIICEYNPFHNGHLYHLQKVKEMFPNETIILILSGHFLQRGDISLINKWDKTRIALMNGIDLVIELPFIFATQSADIFANGAIELLKALKVNYLVFGSEINDLKILSKIASSSNINIKKYLATGLNYPTSLAKSIKDNTNLTINSPNDLLGISYIKAIKEQEANIIPITIQRTNDYHDTYLMNTITSATSIREALNKNIDIKKYVPSMTLKFIDKTKITANYFNYLKYKINSTDDLSIYQTVTEGIDKKIKKVINNVNDFNELILNTKSKRYTYNRIKRMFIHILCNFTKEEAINIHNEYIRILGFSNNGQKYLNQIKKELILPLLNNTIKKSSKIFNIEVRATKIYDDKLYLKEYQEPPIKL